MKISVFAEHIFEAAEQSSLNFSDILYIAKDYGITGLEVDYERISKDQSLPAVIRAHGMEISCVYAFFDFGHNKSIEYAKAVINNLRLHNITRLMAIPGFIEKNEEHEKAISDMYECMNKIADICKDAGISLCLEDFDDERAPYSTCNGLLDFLENVDGLSCAFDTGNFIYSGESETEAFEKLKPYITHLHCKDRKLDFSRYEEPKLTLTNKQLYSSPVGEGVIGIEKIVKELISSGYDGWFAIEHFGTPQQLSYMKQSAEKLKEWYNDKSNSME